MNPLFRSVLVGIVVLLVHGVVFANPAMDWIQKMSEAMRSLSYRGNFVYSHEDQLESMSISHVMDETGEKERLLSLNGEAREVIRDNKNLTCIWPSSRKVVVDVSSKNKFSPIFIPDDIDRISKLYEFKLLGKDRIANYQTVVVHINPRDKYRYGFKFWINEENGLMMKSILINENYEVVEQVMFTHLEIMDKDKKWLNDAIPKLDDSFSLVRYHSGETLRSQATGEWQLDGAPEGFWQESALRRNIPGTEHYVDQMVFTDGLASLSVFIEKLVAQTPRGKTSMGAVNAYIQILNDYSITAIGEVPAITVKQVAESVSFRKP